MCIRDRSKTVANKKTKALFFHERTQKMQSKILAIIKKGNAKESKLRYGNIFGGMYALSIVAANKQSTKT